MPKEPLHSVRIAEELWTAARAKAADEGVAVSAVIRCALQVYTGVERCPHETALLERLGIDPADALDPR